MDKIPRGLLCVKSIITIILCVTFSILCFLYPDTYEDTMKSVIIAVITFYFAHQIEKTQKGDDPNDKR